MKKLKHLLDKNIEWSDKRKSENPSFFTELSKNQSPEYLWIGCSDSRVPESEIVDLAPGDIFVHRNVANIVVHTDMNCLSVIQYAVEALKVKHIIVCGHYGCGGIHHAYHNSRLGLIDNWLKHAQEVAKKHTSHLSQDKSDDENINALCELNVVEQVVNVCQSTIVQKAWDNGQELSVHGWIYGLSNGLINDLGICISSQEELTNKYTNCLATLKTK